MTVYQAIRYLSQFPSDSELVTMVALEPCHDGDWKGCERIPVKNIDYGIPDWHIGDKVRLMVAMKGVK